LTFNCQESDGEGTLLEIIPAVLIGLTVACTVFLLGRRIFVGSESVSDQEAYQAEPSISTFAIDDALKVAVDETETSIATAPLLADQPAKPPKKARKPAAAQSKENAGELSSRPRRRKTKNVTVPGSEVGTAAANGQSSGPTAELR
jgi:hypothetical protein